jgi:hypothetical protein
VFRDGLVKSYSMEIGGALGIYVERHSAGRVARKRAKGSNVELYYTGRSSFIIHPSTTGRPNTAI